MQVSIGGETTAALPRRPWLKKNHKSPSGQPVGLTFQGMESPVLSISKPWN
jgi:hypothetical protein